MTPQQLKAMKQALEALKLLTGAWQTFGALDYGDNAITALEEVLAEHVMQEVQRLGQEIEHDDIASILACRDMLDAQPVPPRTWVGSGDLEDSNAYLTPPQPEQEPVAWIHNFIEGGISIGKRPADLERHPDRWTALYKDPKPCPTCEALARTVMLDQTSHDTTPPQRTEQTPQRKPLTKEEMFEAIRPLYSSEKDARIAVDISEDEYRAIEAAHGIKETK